MASVVLENVNKIFSEPGKKEVSAISRLSLEIPAGALLAVVGPSGSGKTTLLRLIAGLERVTTGKISIAGQCVNEVPPEHRDVAMVFQHDALYPHLTIAENLGFGLKLRRVARAEIDQRVHVAAALLGLTPLLDRLPKSLSGGERQRAALGRAIVRRPKVFLFDEPLSQLDAPLRAELRREIARLHRQLGATMIYVTHDQGEAMALGQITAVLKDGVIQQVADARMLYHEPQNLFVAGFIGSPPANLIRGTLQLLANELCFVSEAGELVLKVRNSNRDRLTANPDRQIVMSVRAEDVLLCTPSRKNTDSNFTNATVEGIEFLGAGTLIHLRIGNLPIIGWEKGGTSSGNGQQMALQFKMENARFFDVETGRPLR